MISLTNSRPTGWIGSLGNRLAPLTLVSPSVLFLSFFMVVPSVALLCFSLMTQAPNGDIGLPLTLNSYVRFFESATYRGILGNTLFIAVATTVVAMIAGYPLAMSIAYGSTFTSRLTMIIVVAPLVVSVLVRTYGWQLLLGNGPAGVLNYGLGLVGLPPVLKILNTKWAVVIASVHVFLPLLVLPLAASLSRIPFNLVEAARMLGSAPWRAFLTITLPLSLPGLLTGATIVFTLTSASYITPQMIGGRGGMMLGVLLEQQVNTVYDWPMASAIGAIMVTISLAAHVLMSRILGRRA